jgi:hypothetical protein
MHEKKRHTKATQTAIYIYILYIIAYTKKKDIKEGINIRQGHLI